MSRETIAAKAARYLASARLTVVAVSGDHVGAGCRGGGEVHRCGHDPGRGWHCSCPARTDRCSHLAALRSVTVRRSA